MKPSILIVGTFHFASSPDLMEVEDATISSQKRQAEIKGLVKKLAKFHPTKIAVEALKEDDGYLNDQYEEFLGDTYDLKVNEIEQIGFRLAKEMNHSNVYPIDWMDDVGNRQLDEVLDWARENQAEHYEAIVQQLPKLEIDVRYRTLEEVFKEINQKDRISTDHRIYMDIARIGKATNYVGIDWLRWWYQRNLIIYHNLTQLIEKSEERILLLIGAGHLHLVSQFLTESGLVEIENVEKYL